MNQPVKPKQTLFESCSRTEDAPATMYRISHRSLVGRELGFFYLEDMGGGVKTFLTTPLEAPPHTLKRKSH